MVVTLSIVFDQAFRDRSPWKSYLSTKYFFLDVFDFIWTLCRYKESKEIEAGLKELKIAIANPSCDNEVLRDYFLKLIRKFVFSALDEIYSFKTEKEILAHMAQMREQSGGACAVVAVQRPKIRYVYYIWKYQKEIW